MKKREILIQFLKGKFLSCHGYKLLHIMHAISSCGDDIRRIIPQSIPKIDLLGTRLSPIDAVAMSNIMHHSVTLEGLDLRNCDLTSQVLSVLADGLRDSKLTVFLTIHF